MKDELKIKDFSNFLRDNIKVMLTTILVAIILTTSFVIYSYTTYEPSETEVTSPLELPVGTISDERYEEISHWPLELYSESQIKQMQAYLLPKAFRLKIYAEHENHEPIDNTTLMREVFRNKEVRDYVESQLDEELTPAIEFAIHIVNLGNSGVFELHLQRGTKEQSLQLAYVVMDAIRDNAIPVLNNKNITLITEEPEIIVRDYSEYIDESSNDSYLSVKSVVKNLVIYNLIALILALIIGVVISFILTLSRSKISALFDYAREESDKIIRLNHLKSANLADKESKALKNINYPFADRKVVLYDADTKEELSELLSNINSDIQHYTDFSLLNYDTAAIDEVILITVVNKTKKDWYNNQRLQLKGYNIPIKVIQFK